MTKQSATGNYLSSFINLNQSKEERRRKYALLIALGHSVADAQRYRDWRPTSLVRIKGIQID